MAGVLGILRYPAACFKLEGYIRAALADLHTEDSNFDVLPTFRILLSVESRSVDSSNMLAL